MCVCMCVCLRVCVHVCLRVCVHVCLCVQYVDLSGNELSEIVLSDSLPATLHELDLTGNSALLLEHKTLNLFRWGIVHFVKTHIPKSYLSVGAFLNNGKDLMCPHGVTISSHITTLKLDHKSAVGTGDAVGTSALWKHGYSEMSGQRNKWVLYEVFKHLLFCCFLSVSIYVLMK